ncbi:MAG: biotin--[acetyl-CoA-carboxylase] ligase [Ruminococcus sp.]|jgi:BirA family biotin operon repressor/biotin-[acetyl-CoA-carboxylase] ligase|nr:biotin--[acetyl-CoA-carboxylase] ligase [Ruminococcus sp.]
MNANKLRILNILRRERGKIISGSDIGKEMDVSRAYVHQKINSLRDEGYEIQSFKPQGYMLGLEYDILSEDEIKKALKTDFIGHSLRITPVEKSTIDVLKDVLKNETGLSNGETIITDRQTNGRGRFLRPFFSPAGTGLYMSIFLTPALRAEKSPLLTVAAACAVADTLSKFGVTAQIKWVNDIVTPDGKKLCGILTEASINVEAGVLSWAIIGIGLNVNISHFPEKLADIAASLLTETGKIYSRNTVAATLLNNLEKRLKEAETQPKKLIKDYKSGSFVLGKTVEVTEGKEIYTAKAIDIDDYGRLIVDRNGEILKISGGGIKVLP